MTIRLRACPAPSSGQWRFCERRSVSASWKRLTPPTTLDAKDWSATPASGIVAVRSGDTVRDCPYRFPARPRLSDTQLGPSTVIVSAVYASHYLDTQFGGGEWEPLQRCLGC